MTEGNTTAFPVAPNNENIYGFGLTKREYFAAMAMQGFLASYAGLEIGVKSNIVATQSVKLADALIEQLNK